jgi:hypothetical protein
VVLVADPRALRTALGEMKREERRTTLAYRIARETVTHKTGEPA